MFKTLLLSTLFLFGLAAFAKAAGYVDLGNFDKEKPGKNNNNNLLGYKKLNTSFNSFSLKSNMQFKGDDVVGNNEPAAINYINLNTAITYQKGQNSYLVPYKRKVIVSRITFNPNEQMRSYTPDK